mmetsp:Transcript_17066/g.16292  ORF Transcript_17066/g.16292 Transcript_17066/m.16292 type:complete len:235 (+) Transcript_17066:319-1023(+)
MHASVDTLLNAIKVSPDSIWVTQKYIENPLIIRNKKFDIRQWVVVSSWQPLKIWYFTDCYLRFSAENYDPSKIHDKFSHLTNNSIAALSQKFEQSDIEGNMWFAQQFSDHLMKMSGESFHAGGENVYRTKVEPQMREGVIASVLAAREMALHRDNAHEMFGYDFMVDTSFNVWLIEVNSSPCMEYSTKVTESLVKELLRDVTALVVDYENGNGHLFEDHQQRTIGKLQLIYSEQ